MGTSENEIPSKMMARNATVMPSQFAGSWIRLIVSWKSLLILSACLKSTSLFNRLTIPSAVFSVSLASCGSVNAARGFIVIVSDCFARIRPALFQDYRNGLDGTLRL